MWRNNVSKDFLNTVCTGYRPPEINPLCWLATSVRSPVWTIKYNGVNGLLCALRLRKFRGQCFNYTGNTKPARTTQEVSLRNILTCKQTYCSDVRKHGKEALSSLNKDAQLFRNQISNPFKILIPWYLFSSCIGVRSQNLATVQFANIRMKHFSNINMF